MKVNLVITCPNCDEEITMGSNHFTDDIPTVNVDEFSQTTWHCSACNNTFFIGDIDIWDKDVFEEDSCIEEDDEDE